MPLDAIAVPVAAALVGSAFVYRRKLRDLPVRTRTGLGIAAGAGAGAGFSLIFEGRHPDVSALGTLMVGGGVALFFAAHPFPQWPWWAWFTGLVLGGFLAGAWLLILLLG